jgi:hypothetical protein
MSDRQSAVWTKMESSFLSFWQNGMMHVDLVLCPSCVHEKVGMNQNDTAIRINQYNLQVTFVYIFYE